MEHIERLLEFGRGGKLSEAEEAEVAADRRKLAIGGAVAGGVGLVGGSAVAGAWLRRKLANGRLAKGLAGPARLTTRVRRAGLPMAQGSGPVPATIASLLSPRLSTKQWLPSLLPAQPGPPVDRTGFWRGW